jgi:hypothetical protein
MVGQEGLLIPSITMLRIRSIEMFAEGDNGDVSLVVHQFAILTLNSDRSGVRKLSHSTVPQDAAQHSGVDDQLSKLRLSESW